MFSMNLNKICGIQNKSISNITKKFFGKNEKAIKMRIKSVSSIEKITKAMKMVFKYITKIGGSQ
jgi:hypothetical protein